MSERVTEERLTARLPIAGRARAAQAETELEAVRAAMDPHVAQYYDAAEVEQDLTLWDPDE